jgi:UDP-GlcNAc:undecaprenyl-phosphate/decaprenyl-phosphate GlcNAc-1-phosphate transferase
MPLLTLLVIAVTFALCASLVPLTRPLAHAVGAIDLPGPRKHHPGPTPRIGGVALFVAVTGVVAAGYLLAPRLSSLGWPALEEPLGALREAPRVASKLTAVLVGAALCFVVGLLDDLLGARFPVAAKLAGQAMAASVIVFGGVRTTVMPADWMNVVLTLLWLVGVTNAFNLLDNMDGLTAGVAFVASLVFLLNAWLLGELFMVLILAAFMGGLLGFLVFNAPPARVFLGDCGSLFIGCVMASLTLLERYVSHASSTLFPVLMPVIVLAVPLIDTFMVTAVRVKEGRPVYVGDRLHLSHRLVSHGLTPRAAVTFLYLATFFLGLGALTLPHATTLQSLLVLVQTAGVVALLLWLIFARRGTA